MEIAINASALIDSPYTKETGNTFAFDENQVEDFANDISLGPQTCYLVSGYRGVGKTSLIKKVEQRIFEQAKVDNKKDSSETVFIYTNFAGYTSKNHLVRKLIRELFLKIEKSNKYQKIDNSLPKANEFKTRLNLLYTRTFNEVLEVNDKSTETEKAFSTNFSLVELTKLIAKNCIPLVSLVIWQAFQSSKIEMGWIVDWLIPIGLIVWQIINIVNIQITYLKKRRTFQNLSTKTLYDDEIAGTLFFEVLREAKDHGFNIVYVLDELDKVSSEHLKQLFNELKSYLVSGLATFVVVGGQDFYYKFREKENKDDSILSSLFSKTFHVPLASSEILKNNFYKFIVQKEAYEKLGPTEKEQLEVFADFLILKSRLIPRRFIMRLREYVFWKDGNAFLSDNNLPHYSAKCKKIIDLIDDFDDTKISPENTSAIRDFIIMQLYIKTYKSLASSSSAISKSDFING